MKTLNLKPVVKSVRQSFSSAETINKEVSRLTLETITCDYLACAYVGGTLIDSLPAIIFNRGQENEVCWLFRDESERIVEMKRLIKKKECREKMSEELISEFRAKRPYEGRVEAERLGYYLREGDDFRPVYNREIPLELIREIDIKEEDDLFHGRMFYILTFNRYFQWVFTSKEECVEECIEIVNEHQLQEKLVGLAKEEYGDGQRKRQYFRPAARHVTLHTSDEPSILTNIDINVRDIESVKRAGFYASKDRSETNPVYTLEFTYHHYLVGRCSAIWIFNDEKDREASIVKNNLEHLIGGK